VSSAARDCCPVSETRVCSSALLRANTHRKVRTECKNSGHNDLSMSPMLSVGLIPAHRSVVIDLLERQFLEERDAMPCSSETPVETTVRHEGLGETKDRGSIEQHGNGHRAV